MRQDSLFGAGGERQRLPPSTWIDAKEGKFAWREDGVAVCNFGKHQGVPLAEIPRGYLRWIVDGGFPDDAKAVAANACRGRYPTRGTAAPLEHDVLDIGDLT